LNPLDITEDAILTAEGVRRIRRGHLWVYGRDVVSPPGDSAIVRVLDGARNLVGYAFHSPRSQIRLRYLTRGPEPPDLDFFRQRIRQSIARRPDPGGPGQARRLVYAEADLLPSVVVDQYGDHLALQTLSHPADRLKPILVDLLVEYLQPTAVVERNDVKARRLEGLEEIRGSLMGQVDGPVEVQEGDITFRVDLLQGQKTGFFLDQSQNRLAARNYCAGRALDCFTYTGAFALHMAARCETVLAVDISPEALAQGRQNADRNGARNLEFRQANVFDLLRELDRAGATFDTVCLDPPAFAKSKAARAGAVSGYKEINLRAMKILAPGGILVTSSCSYQLSEGDFAGVILAAAQDAKRYVQILERRSQASDHPVLVGMPETHYLKCFILRVL